MKNIAYPPDASYMGRVTIFI